MKKCLLGLLAAVMCLGMAACAPSTVEKAKDKMEKKGYNVLDFDNVNALGFVGGFVAIEDDPESKLTFDYDMMTGLLFETKEDAERFYGNVSEEGAGMDGKWVYWGDDDVTEDFTGLF